MKKSLLFILFSFLVLAVSGCKASSPTMSVSDTIKSVVVKTDTVYISKVDSAYIYDSVFVKEKGDTVYFSKWHTQYKYKTDTIYHDKLMVDTMYVTNTNVVQVKTPLTWWEKVRLYLGTGLLCVMIAALLYFIARLVVTVIKRNSS